MFIVTLGKKSKPVGVGFVRRAKKELPEDERGIAISTYGKVIKTGWDWIGINPKNPEYIQGMVEVPDLAAILTTNKADFLRDTNSLQKYYRYRNAIKSEVEFILKRYGEISRQPKKFDKDLRPLEKEIEKALNAIANDFPEILPLLGERREGSK